MMTPVRVFRANEADDDRRYTKLIGYFSDQDVAKLAAEIALLNIKV